MNGIVLFMTLFFGVMLGVLFSTPIMDMMASTYVYANGNTYIAPEEGTVESQW